MAVEDHVHRIARERLLQSARSEVRVDLQRLAGHGAGNWGVVQQGDLSFRPEPAQCTLQLQCLINGFPHELLDQRLPPGAKRPAAEPAGKALHASKTDPEELMGLAIENPHPGIAQDSGDLADLSAFVVVVSEDRYDGDRH